MPQLQELSFLDELTCLSAHDRSVQSAGTCGLISEHLRAARTALLGAMQGEYRLSLQQAMESVSCIPEPNGRIKAKQILQKLIDLSVLPRSL